MNRTENEEILYDFTLYFDTLYSSSLDLEGEVVLVWNKGSKKRIVGENHWTTRNKETLIAKAIKLQIPLFYDRENGVYLNGASAKFSWYVIDLDYTQPVLVGIASINLSKIINENRDQRKGKITNIEYQIPLERWDYPNTSLKLVVSARKNFKSSPREKIREINKPKVPESQDGTFQILSNDMIDNVQENYVDEEEDEFFRGYSHAKEYDQARGTYKSERDTQDIRNKILLEDFTPGRAEPKRTNDMPVLKDNLFEGMRTPPKGDQDTVHITQTREKKDYRFGSGNKPKFSDIKMVNFDQIEESKIEKYEDTSGQPQERGSTLKNILDLYEKDFTSFVNTKQMENSRETTEEMFSSDK